MKDKPRIGCGTSWDRIEIFNGNYSASGVKIGDFDKPWNVFAPDITDTYATFQEALEALQEAGER